jgi:hypothetical protein
MSIPAKHLYMTPGTWLSLIIVIIALICSKTLPAAWGQENGPIEWSQVVILGFAVLAAILAAYCGVSPLSTRRLFLWSALIWLLAIGRELSWGRVLYVDSTGNFIKLTDLWYGAYVHPLVACIIIITIGGLLKAGLVAEILNWKKYGTIPRVEIAIILGAGIIATVVEHYSFGIFGVNEELYEELAEIVCYSAILLLIIDLGFHRKIQPTRQRH